MGTRKTNSDYDEKTKSIIQDLVEAEETALIRRQQRKAELEACECKEGMFPTGGMTSVSSRRDFMKAATCRCGGPYGFHCGSGPGPAGCGRFSSTG